ncbi:MAG: hypothetical protein H0X51_05440 [Parachlamydiaceae bacterium]|nr:hypothetical protein [Parachlamydiaceae bacterium]
MSKLKLWQEHPNWDAAEQAWDAGKQQAAAAHPLKGLKQLPDMPGMTPETAKGLKWKSFKWMITQDHNGEVFRGFFEHPLKYGWAFLKSIWTKKSFRREGDFFLYGLKSTEAFRKLLEKQDTLLVVGFSYCHKPFECPSGRFTDQCIHQADNPVCRQCFIGKAVNALPDQRTIPLFIPTVHYIGGKIFEIVHKNPDKQVIFLITACEMTLEMFGDWGNMVNIQGIGVRLDGRICNTMKAFELSERGIKPGLTVVLDDTQSKILDLIRYRREATRD